MKKQLVLMDYDGGVDDYLATMLLLTMEHIELLGIVVTPADCYIQSAVSVTRKIIDLMGFSHIPIAESTVRGINPFPHLYRRDSLIIDHLPILNQKDFIHTPLLTQIGEDFMIKVLREAPEAVTLMVTVNHFFNYTIIIGLHLFMFFYFKEPIFITFYSNKLNSNPKTTLQPFLQPKFPP